MNITVTDLLKDKNIENYYLKDIGSQRYFIYQKVYTFLNMKKIRTTITINKDLLKKAKKHNIKINTFR